MKTFYAVSLLAAMALGGCGAHEHAEYAPEITTEADAQAQYDAYRYAAYNEQIEILMSRPASYSGCTKDNVKIRKEWSTLSLTERQSYIDAVLCLQAKPSALEPGLAPGAISRFDDFSAVHINQTTFIHQTSIFLHWHRYFLQAFENALRDECGFTGAQPYWDWSANNASIVDNALFSEGPGSLGCNGASIPHNDSTITFPTVPPASIVIPAGTGGGCVTSGPFVNQTIALGPGPSLEYNPRCLDRDFRPDTLINSMTYMNVTANIALPNITVLQDTMELGGSPRAGLHAAGHGSIGGAMIDLYSSSLDPAFYFHHAQLDHVWTLWQAQDFETRTKEVGKTLTWANSPPSADGTLDTPMDLGCLAGTQTIAQLSSTIDGPFCYIYA